MARLPFGISAEIPLMVPVLLVINLVTDSFNRNTYQDNWFQFQFIIDCPHMYINDPYLDKDVYQLGKEVGGKWLVHLETRPPYNRPMIFAPNNCLDLTRNFTIITPVSRGLI